MSVFTRWLLAAAFVVALGAIPLPYYLIAPGTAVDLTHAITVHGRLPPSDRFFLTDVTLQRASAIRLISLAFPGVKLQPIEAVAPSGARDLDAISTVQMETSQEVASVVAERAAGYRVEIPAMRTEILSVAPQSRAQGVLLAGDVITQIDQTAIRDARDVRDRVQRSHPGDRLRVKYRRAGVSAEATIPTIALEKRSVLGIRTQSYPAPVDLPVPVRFGVGDIGGPSGGLMFALEIYRTLRPGPSQAERRIAGTGTIAFDGRVGPIEGTRQKLIAAKRAGATLFLVPRENFADIKDEGGVRIVPVDTFADALRAIAS